MAKSRWLVLWLLAVVVLSAQTPARYALMVGSSRIVDLGTETDLVVSRRGFVDIQHLEGGRWRLTGLRRGFVAVRQQKADMPSAPRFFIQITSPDEEKSRPAQPKGNPPWLCSPASILCDDSNGFISGEAPSQVWLDRAVEHCRERKDCFVDAVLGAEARELADRQYRLKARAFLLDDQEAEEFGFSQSLSAQVDWVKGVSSVVAATRLQAYLRDHNRRRVGEPLIRLRAGVSYKVMTGGEMALRDKTDQKERVEWKGYGFDLTVTVDPRGDDRVNLRYDMALRDRADGDGDVSLSRNGLAGETVVPLGRPVLLGTVDFANEGTRHNGLAWLATIPIIGPLFRSTVSEEGKTHLYLMVQVMDDFDGDLGKGLDALAGP